MSLLVDQAHGGSEDEAPEQVSFSASKEAFLKQTATEKRILKQSRTDGKLRRRYKDTVLKEQAAKNKNGDDGDDGGDNKAKETVVDRPSTAKRTLLAPLDPSLVQRAIERAGLKRGASQAKTSPVQSSGPKPRDPFIDECLSKDIILLDDFSVDKRAPLYQKFKQSHFFGQRVKRVASRTERVVMQQVRAHGKKFRAC